jgi:8-oxo-dGTP pyrophosphatase MutT (NUDIX family)
VKKQAAVVLIVREIAGNPQLLAVTNRHLGGWSLPGGKSEPDEGPKTTAARELFEETKLVVTRSHFILLAKGPGSADATRLVFLYYALTTTGDPVAIELGTELRWMTFNELRAHSVFGPYYCEHLPDGIEHLRPTRML